MTMDIFGLTEKQLPAIISNALSGESVISY